MKALVLGGGGHIGNAFVRTLLAGGHEVSAAGRRSQMPNNLAGLNARYVQVSGNASELGASLRGYDLIIDAAAPYALNNVDQPLAEARGAAILEACAIERARLIHVGTFTTLVEQDSLTARMLSDLHPYFALKKALQTQVEKSGEAAVIINPTYCLGPWDDRPLKYALLPLLARGDVPFSSNHRVNVIDVRDVAAAGIRALEQELFRQPLLLAGHNTTLDTLFARVAQLSNSQPPFWRASAEVGALTVFALEKLAQVTGQSHAYPSLGLVLLLCQQWLFPNRAQRQLGLTLSSMSKTLRDALNYYQARPDLQDASPEPARSVG